LAQEQVLKIKTFKEVALDWHVKQSNTWSVKHCKTVIQRLEKNVFNLIGHLPIADITPRIVLDVLLKIEEREAFETAHRVKSIIGQVFRFGIPYEYCDRDITQDLRGALTPTRPKNFASITNPDEIGIMLNLIDDYTGHLSTQFALKIMPHVFVRSYPMRYAEWTEFDLDQAVWSVPAEKMKKSEPFIVPLSTQVMTLLLDLKSYNLPSKFLFMGVDATKPISDNTMRLGLRRIGYTSEQMTVHGFRHMASTRLNEMGFDPDLIEKQLAHTSSDKVRSAYNHAQWLPERKKMMQKWSDYLDGLKSKPMG
jgi:integrase